jgi:hypothetical protein
MGRGEERGMMDRIYEMRRELITSMDQEHNSTSSVQYAKYSTIYSDQRVSRLRSPGTSDRALCPKHGRTGRIQPVGR